MKKILITFTLIISINLSGCNSDNILINCGFDTCIFQVKGLEIIKKECINNYEAEQILKETNNTIDETKNSIILKQFRKYNVLRKIIVKEYDKIREHIKESCAQGFSLEYHTYTALEHKSLGTLYPVYSKEGSALCATSHKKTKIIYKSDKKISIKYIHPDFDNILLQLNSNNLKRQVASFNYTTGKFKIIDSFIEGNVFLDKLGDTILVYNEDKNILNSYNYKDGSYTHFFQMPDNLRLIGDDAPIKRRYVHTVIQRGGKIIIRAFDNKSKKPVILLLPVKDLKSGQKYKINSLNDCNCQFILSGIK